MTRKKVHFALRHGDSYLAARLDLHLLLVLLGEIRLVRACHELWIVDGWLKRIFIGRVTRHHIIKPRLRTVNAEFASWFRNGSYGDRGYRIGLAQS